MLQPVIANIYVRRVIPAFSEGLLHSACIVVTVQVLRYGVLIGVRIPCTLFRCPTSSFFRTSTARRSGF